MTVVNNKLYVLRDRDPINVYTTTDFTHLRRFTVADADPAALEDIASCPRKRCIYVSSSGGKCIHRLGLDDSVSKWPLRGAPTTLSVMRNSNLLSVSINSVDHLKKMMVINSENGECLLETGPEGLRRDIDIHLSDTVQLNNDTFAIVYGKSGKSAVSHVEKGGRILRSSNRDASMIDPFRMVTDGNDFLLVADVEINGVIVFDPSLEYVGDLAEGTVTKPCALYYDDVSRRLYVGQQNGKIVVIQL